MKLRSINAEVIIMNNIKFVNYGDVNFFELGILVDAEHSDTEFSVLYCRPYDDEEDLYFFADCEVDITDSWTICCWMH